MVDVHSPKRTEGLVNLAIMKYYAFVGFITKMQCAEGNNARILSVYSDFILTHTTTFLITRINISRMWCPTQCHFVSFYANLTLIGVSSLHNGYASNDLKRRSYYLIFIQKQK